MARGSAYLVREQRRDDHEVPAAAGERGERDEDEVGRGDARPLRDEVRPDEVAVVRGADPSAHVLDIHGRPTFQLLSNILRGVQLLTTPKQILKTERSVTLFFFFFLYYNV